MALKALMLGQSIAMREAELATLREKDTEFSTREAELETAIGEVETEEQRSAVEAMVAEFEEQRTAHDAAVAAKEGEIEALRAELAEIEKRQTLPAPAAVRGAEHIKMEVPTMHSNVNIRSLPRNQRAFEAAYTYEERCAIVQREDFTQFVEQLRSLAGKSTRAVTGAELMIPEVLVPLIAENMFRYSKLMNRVRVETVAGNARQTIAGLVPPAVWTECCGRLNEITFQFGQWPMGCNKLGAFLPICNSLLEDTSASGVLNLAAALVEVISQSLGMAKDIAVLYGTGIGMPLGIVTRLAQTSQPSDYPATAPAWTDLHTSNIITINGDSLTGAEFWAALEVAAGNTFTRYSRGELFWAMNSKTYSYLKSKAIATTVTGEWVALIGGRLPIVSGDVDVLEFMPDYDIVGGYGDLYLWAQRDGTIIGIDDVGYTNRVNDQTIFFGKERADGAPIIPGAFVAMNLRNTAVTTTYAFPTDDANDATLQALTVGSLSLSPTFDPATLTYTASATNATASAAVTAIANQNGAQVGITVTSGTTTKNVNNGGNAALAVGANTIAVTVKQGTKTLTYTVTVTRAAS